MGYNLYAYAHTRNVKRIDIMSIGDWNYQLSTQSPAGVGRITQLVAIFEKKKPAPLIFTWKPDKYIPAAHFTALKNGEDFSLDLRISGTDGSFFYLFFAQCKFMKALTKSGTVTVEATCNNFSKEAK